MVGEVKNLKACGLLAQLPNSSKGKVLSLPGKTGWPQGEQVPGPQATEAVPMAKRPGQKSTEGI